MHSLGKKNNFLFQLPPIFKALRITLFKVRLLKQLRYTIVDITVFYKTERYVDDVAQSVSTS